MEDQRHRRFGRRAPILGVLALTACLGLAAPAAAHNGEIHGSTDVERSIGDHVKPAGEGLYEVRIGRGESLTTHGPDPAPSGRSETRAAGGVFGPSGEQRAPACATDYHQHILVGHVAGAPDRVAEVAESVRAAIRRMNWVLNADALESGGITADYKVLCDSAGQIRVDTFASPSNGFEDIVRAARAAGFDASNADYTIFFDSSGPNGGCGIGSYREDERLTATNLSNTGGGYGVSYQPCWFGTTPMHENAHNQGAVQYGAPQGTGTGGHCNQGHDVLCYAPDGGDRNQTGLTIACTDRPHFDCGGDDYFDPAPEPGEYLESHWNLGSPLNRFIAFGGGTTGPAPTGGPAGEGSCGTACTIKRLRLGVSVEGLAAGEALSVYRFRLPRGKRALQVTLKGSEDLGLYLRRGEAPDREEWDCAATDAGSNRRCRITAPRSGTWFVGIGEPEGTAGAESGEFELRADAFRR